MSRLLESKILTSVALLMVVAVVVLSLVLHEPWWTIIPMFFAFMMAFSHLSSLILRRMNAYASKKLDLFAAIFGVLFIVSIIGVFIAFQCLV